MSFFQPGADKYYLFGKEGGAALAKEFNLDLLGEIPIVEKAEQSKNGQVYLEIASKIAQKVSIHNAE
jgi:ATP-binding protein involved in chromosome partitioning